MIKVFSLFSGFGTQELGLKYAGIDHQLIGYSDINKKVTEVYDSLHQTKYGNLGDITKITSLPKEVDLLTYSFPCQDVSIAGKQKGIKKGTRSGLLIEVERLLSTHPFRVLLMENVKNLVSKKHLPTLLKHIGFLNSIGYGCHYMVLNSADYGCPQNRERVFMVGILFKTNEEVKEIMERVLFYKEPRKTIRDIMETVVDSSLYVECDYTLKKTSQNSVCKQVGTRTDVNYEQSQRIYSIDGCSPCLTKSSSPLILTDGGVRHLSPKESLRCMGIKEEDIDVILSTNKSIRFYQSICGDAICVPVIQKIFHVIFGDTEKKHSFEKNKTMSIYYKNESDFQGPIESPDELNEMEIRIHPYWYVDDYGQIHLDIESMMSEFKTHLQGLEIICDDFNESI